MPTKTNSIASQLEEIEKAEGKLPDLLEFYKKLLRIQDRVGQQISVPNPIFTTEAIRAHALSGKPLLGFTELAIDWTLLRKIYKEVVVLFHEYHDLFGTLPEDISNLTPGQVVSKRNVRSWYRGKPIVLNTESTDQTHTLLEAILGAALKPFLVREALVLHSSLDMGNWRRGYCPICSGNPDFSFLVSESGERWLICSRCDTEWLFQRLQCPYCDNADQNKLSFFTNETGTHRLYVCDRCKHYLKAVDLRQAKKSVIIPLERLLTLDLDQQAQEKGYSPCA